MREEQGPFVKLAYEQRVSFGNMVIEYLLCFKKINFILVAQVSGSQVLRPPGSFQDPFRLFEIIENVKELVHAKLLYLEIYDRRN